MKKMKRWLILSCAVGLAFALAPAAGAQDSDQVTDAVLQNAHGKFAVVTPHAHLNGQAHARHGIPSIDSLVNFNGHYFADGFDSNGNPNRHWYFNTVGNPPQHRGSTVLNAPVVPVSLDLLDFDGSVRFHYDAAQFVAPTLASPVFQNSTFSSSTVPTQVTDAVQRASYWSDAKDDWHTLLAPSVKTGRVIRLPRGTYAFSLNGDGSCCRFVLVDFGTFVNLLFPATASDTSTPVGAAENAGDVTTKDVSTFLFPNTYLFEGSLSNCCVLGFHSYDFEPGDDSNGNVEKRYVLDYASWISPGLFGGGFEDITALSHEVAEIFNDPFVASDGVHNVTPWWLSPPGASASNGLCQNTLEVGDVIEVFPNATFPVTLNGITYHPQTEALLPWFEFQSPSSAIHGAYSYPDESVLTSLSAPQKANCQP